MRCVVDEPQSQHRGKHRLLSESLHFTRRVPVCRSPTLVILVVGPGGLRFRDPERRDVPRVEGDEGARESGRQGPDGPSYLVTEILSV